MIIDGDYHDDDLGERVLTVASLTRALMIRGLYRSDLI